MSELTKEEKAWLRKLQRVLNDLPSTRLGFYTIGDSDVVVYDRSLESDIESKIDESGNMDFCTAVDACDAGFGFGEFLRFPAPVHSTAG